MSWTVGNEHNINIADDRWIGLDKLERPKSSLPMEWTSRKVSKLIDEDTWQWKVSLIESMFESNDARKITSMQQPRVMMEFQRVWRLTKQGRFTIRLHT